MSFSDDPPLEAMTGLPVVAIFSISTQSLMSELAILMICTLSSTHLSTETSSNGVAIVIIPFSRTALVSIA